MDWLGWVWQFLVSVTVGSVCYIFLRKKVETKIPASWRFRIDNFGLVLKSLMPWAIASVILSFIIGSVRDTMLFHWHFFPTLLYPLWGVIQQYLCMALVAGNLKHLQRVRIGNGGITLLTSLLFGLMHLPDLWLSGATFLMALIYAWHYLRDQNLYVLGLLHGILGAVFYFIALGKDPWLRVWG